MAKGNKHGVIVSDLKRAKNLTDVEPDDLTLWALLNLQAQISEALTGVFLHRSCHHKVAAAVMMIRRAGRICHAVRRDMLPQRGTVEYVDSQTEEELAEAFAWLLTASRGSGGKGLQFLAARYARLALKDTLQASSTDLDLVAEVDPAWDELAAEEALPDDDAIEDFLRDLDARSLDADGDIDDLDGAVADERDE